MGSIGDDKIRLERSAPEAIPDPLALAAGTRCVERA